MATLVAEEIKEAEAELKPEPVEAELKPEQAVATQWCFRMPCAGVKYYSFETRPTRLERVEPRAWGDTKGVIP